MEQRNELVEDISSFIEMSLNLEVNENGKIVIQLSDIVPQVDDLSTIAENLPSWIETEEFRQFLE